MNEARRQLLEKLKRVLAIGVDRPLKAAGYRKQGFRYSRKVADGLLHLVEVQRGRFPAPDETQFAASCGAYLTLVWSLFPDRFDVGKPCVSCCLVQTRIGFLGPEQLDTWWRVRIADDEQTLERTAQDLHQRFEHQVLPWLAQFSSAKAIGDYLVAPEEGPGRIRISYRDIVQGPADLRDAAIAYFGAGEYDRAREMLDLAEATIDRHGKHLTADLRQRIERLIAQRQQAPRETKTGESR